MTMMRPITTATLLAVIMIGLSFAAVAQTVQQGDARIEYKFIPQQAPVSTTTVTTTKPEAQENTAQEITTQEAEPTESESETIESEDLIFEEIPEEDKMEDMPFVRLRSLDKITARTVTFEAKVGSTIHFGNIFIKIQSCRKATPIEEPESAAFLQIWQGADEWIFSGWMYASSPGLSYMDHPVYDVWVLDCLAEKTKEPDTTKEDTEQAKEGEGEVKKPVQKPDEKQSLEKPATE